LRLRVESLAFEGWGLRFRRFRVEGEGFGVSDLCEGFGVSGLWFGGEGTRLVARRLGWVLGSGFETFRV
jgi:hypothetical protein